MSTLTLKELSAPTGEVIKIASGKTLDLNSQGTLILPTVPSSKMPTGSVLQVVQTNSATQVNVTSTTLIDSGHSVTITPSSTSSHVFVVFTFNAHVATANEGMKYALYRNSTQIGDESIVYNSASNVHHSVAQQFVDSPSSTSPVVYKIYFASYGGNSMRIASDWGHTIMTAMEIQG